MPPMRNMTVWLAVLLLWPGGAGAVESLSILDTAGQCHRFRVEMALSVEERTRGLSGRHELPRRSGMLFYFDGAEAPVTMWMKDTWLPLDMLFIRASGEVVHIAEQTTPLALDHIPSGRPVQAVLELNGGLAQELGLTAGARVVHPRFAGAGRHCVGD